jgi:hypothetical protein
MWSFWSFQLPIQVGGDEKKRALSQAKRLKLLFTDGYVYTHTTNRQWNKNRRSVGSGCFGVDINANFYYQFLRTNDVSVQNAHELVNLTLFFTALCGELLG